MALRRTVKFVIGLMYRNDVDMSVAVQIGQNEAVAAA